MRAADRLRGRGAGKDPLVPLTIALALMMAWAVLTKFSVGPFARFA